MHLETERDPDGGWFDRFVRLVDEDGELVEDFGEHPTLDKLREVERRTGSGSISGNRDLSATNVGTRLTTASPPKLTDIYSAGTVPPLKRVRRRAASELTSTRQTSVLSASKLHEKSLCDYVINVATGCRHGCRFCYVPSTPAVDSREEMLEEKAEVDDPQRNWGSYILYRDDLPERLHQGLQKKNFSDWKKTDRGRGIVMLSSGTDCYQDRRAAQITHGCVQELIEHDIPVRILSRSPNLTRDIDLFKKAGDRIAVGTSIPTFDASLVNALEPNAPPPQARWEALDQLFRAGVPRFVSFSPTYPTMSRGEIREALGWFAAVDPDVGFPRTD